MQSFIPVVVSHQRISLRTTSKSTLTRDSTRDSDIFWDAGMNMSCVLRWVAYLLNATHLTLCQDERPDVIWKQVWQGPVGTENSRFVTRFRPGHWLGARVGGSREPPRPKLEKCVERHWPLLMKASNLKSFRRRVPHTLRTWRYWA